MDLKLEVWIFGTFVYNDTVKETKVVNKVYQRSHKFAKSAKKKILPPTSVY